MSTSPHPVIMTLRILWFAMLSSQGIFVFIIFFLASQEDAAATKSPQDMQMIILALSAVSATLLPMALVMRRFMMGRAEATPDQVPALYQTYSILGWSLAEAVTIHGFVIAFMSMDPRLIVPFVIGGVGCTLMTFPRPQQLSDYISVARKKSDEDAPESEAW